MHAAASEAHRSPATQPRPNPNARAPVSAPHITPDQTSHPNNNKSDTPPNSQRKDQRALPPPPADRRIAARLSISAYSSRLKKLPAPPRAPPPEPEAPPPACREGVRVAGVCCGTPRGVRDASRLPAAPAAPAASAPAAEAGTEPAWAPSPPLSSPLSKATSSSSNIARRLEDPPLLRALRRRLDLVEKGASSPRSASGGASPTI